MENAENSSHKEEVKNKQPSPEAHKKTHRVERGGKAEQIQVFHVKDNYLQDRLCYRAQIR